MLIYIKIESLTFIKSIPGSFSFGKAPLKILFWYCVQLRRYIFFDVLNVLNFDPWDNFQFWNNKKIIESAILAQSYVSPKPAGQKVSKINRNFSKPNQDSNGGV